MSATIVHRPSASTQAWQRGQQRAYGYREVAFAILLFGIYLHLSRLVFGPDLVQGRLLLPRVDEVFGSAMTYAAVAGVAGWRALRFRGVWHRRMSKFIVGFIMVSAPIHLATLFRWSAAPWGALPWWYSFVEGALLYPFFASTVWRLSRAADVPIKELQSQVRESRTGF